MPTRVRDRPGLGGAAKLVADKASAIIRLELALAAAELKKKVVALGLGIGLLLGAAIFGVFAVGFLFATAAAALATVVSVWLALLIVAGTLLMLTGLLAGLGIASVGKGTPPVPVQAIEEARLTTEALRNGKH